MTSVLLRFDHLICANCDPQDCECDKAERRIEAERQRRAAINSLPNLSPREKRERIMSESEFNARLDELVDRSLKAEGGEEWEEIARLEAELLEYAAVVTRGG